MTQLILVKYIYTIVVYINAVWTIFFVTRIIHISKIVKYKINIIIFILRIYNIIIYSHSSSGSFLSLYIIYTTNVVINYNLIPIRKPQLYTLRESSFTENMVAAGWNKLIIIYYNNTIYYTSTHRFKDNIIYTYLLHYTQNKQCWPTIRYPACLVDLFTTRPW